MTAVTIAAIITYVLLFTGSALTQAQIVSYFFVQSFI
jgi:hypothetical protein